MDALRAVSALLSAQSSAARPESAPTALRQSARAFAASAAKAEALHHAAVSLAAAECQVSA
jgi:hypothetical protein